MPCVHCAKIRTALIHGKMAEAAGLSVDALREKIGWKAPGTVPADPPALDGKKKDELLDVAASEGADVDASATKPQIVEAIEANRLDA
jgi:hypothetical protein